VTTETSNRADAVPLAASIVVPTIGRRESIARLLAALAGQTFATARFEAIIVADGATDGTVELVRSFEAPYQLHVIAQERRGRSAACNVGIAAGRGDLVVILDDDMKPTPGWLAAHVGAHSDRRDICVIGSVPIVPDPAESALQAWVRQNFEQHMVKLAEPGRPLEVADFYSGNTSFPRNVLVTIGGYDESFAKLYGNEDLELYVRLRRAGVTAVFSEAALAWQEYDKTFMRFALDTIDAGTTAELFARKHAGVARDLVSFRRGRGFWLRLNRVLVRTTSRRDFGVRAAVALQAVAARVLPGGLLSRFYWYASSYLFWVGVARGQRDGVHALRL
jgi:glycosyltransferase involved in cell wall biosynthesis